MCITYLHTSLFTVYQILNFLYFLTISIVCLFVFFFDLNYRWYSTWQVFQRILIKFYFLIEKFCSWFVLRFQWMIKVENTVTPYFDWIFTRLFKIIFGLLHILFGVLIREISDSYFLSLINHILLSHC